MEFLSEIKRLLPKSEVILLTAYGNIPDGVKAIKNGAFGYITKGDDNDKIIPLLHRAMERVKAMSDSEGSVSAQGAFAGVIGSSKKNERGRFACGKGLLHKCAGIADVGDRYRKRGFRQCNPCRQRQKVGPFVAVNCSALGKDILESELFGYKAGAFTGAVKDKKGFLEEARGGTIFLDEIGEMPVELQAKLLRVFESEEFIRVGDTKPIKADIRVISATNRDLLAEIDDGSFRRDLYFRLSVFQISLPPLAERPSDIRNMSNILLRFFRKNLAGK